MLFKDLWGACITSKALTYPESLTSSLLPGSITSSRGERERGRLTSAAPCVTAEKQQGNFQ